MKFILYIFLLIVSTSIFAQNAKWINYSRDYLITDIGFHSNCNSGLLHNNISDLVQDYIDYDFNIKLV